MAKKFKKKKKSKFHIDLDIEEQGDDDYMFDDWDKQVQPVYILAISSQNCRWRQADGFMCRDDNDCNWLDEDLRVSSDYDATSLLLKVFRSQKVFILQHYFF